jgi:UDP-2,3-diacylglucosamine hydrolase
MTAADEAAERMVGPATPLAIVAGRGALPRRIAEQRAAAGLPYFLVIFRGSFEPWMADHPHQHHEFEKAGRLFRALRAAGTTHVVFAGAMARPRLRPWRADLRALRLLVRALALLQRGDDAMLRGFAAVFEAEGLSMLGPHEILGGQAMVPQGALGARAPGAHDRRDAAQAARIVAALGPLDVGQGAVVAGGLCLAVEAIEGTDLMLARVAELPPDRRAAAPPPAGVLYKGPKPGQDRRLDLPAIGPETVAGTARAGLKGIVVAAGETVLLDASATRRAADQAGIFVYGATPDELASWTA